MKNHTTPWYRKISFWLLGLLVWAIAQRAIATTSTLVRILQDPRVLCAEPTDYGYWVVLKPGWAYSVTGLPDHIIEGSSWEDCWEALQDVHLCGCPRCCLQTTLAHHDALA